VPEEDLLLVKLGGPDRHLLGKLKEVGRMRAGGLTMAAVRWPVTFWTISSGTPEIRASVTQLIRNE
jgi:hypothetical protein